mmetsp:Transcript_12135/g.25612  ORF Transcript_12135/g.25612 Transcript_12135/m.25612 type:complete len:478 (+) Transcript_12135:228-1661(+)
MGEPLVVEGTAVASPYDHTTIQQSAPDPSGRGEKQETKCRDPIFALLLYGNVGAIAGVAAAYGTAAFSEAVDDGNSGYNYQGYINVAFVTGAIAIVLSGGSLPIMMCIPTALIKVSLFTMLILSGAMMVMSFIYGNIWGGIFGAIFFAIFLCYARAVWSRIPFASINLLTACTAVKHNAGVILVAYFFIALAFGWSLLWAVALTGVWEKVIVESENPFEENKVGWGYLFLLFLSYFFTHQVIQNSTHVTVAGTVGTWWFSPEDGSSCCSSGVRGSLIRTLTTSFGSICFGSLLVALIQALKALAQSARDGDNQLLICFAECILNCLESILEYFNRWAFVYVGLYGYSYLEAGKQVFTLFKDRGWEAIIADDLISNVFFFISLVIGGLCGAFGMIFVDSNPEWFVNSPAGANDQATCFMLGFIVGLVLTSILMSTIASAVNTVIVCFAEGPAEFEANHPELSRKMRETWISFYPDCGV